MVFPSLNCTLPVEIAPLAVTVATKVNACPWLEGFVPEVKAREIVVGEGATRNVYAEIAPGMGLLWKPVWMESANCPSAA